MEESKLKRNGIVAFTAVLLLVVTLPLRAELLKKTKDVTGTTVHYKVVLPIGRPLPENSLTRALEPLNSAEELLCVTENPVPEIGVYSRPAA